MAIKRKQITEENALARMETLCARSEHCTYEALSKLRGWGITGEAAERIVNALTDNRFIDDSRFARSYVNDRYRFSGHGRYKIRLALAAKRLPRDIIDSALEEIDPDIYRDNLRKLLRSRAARANGLDSFDGRTRLYRYGISRGYESGLVAEALKEILKSIRPRQ